MTFGFFRARILTHFRAAALGFEPKLPGSLAIVSKWGGIGLPEPISQRQTSSPSRMPQGSLAFR